MYVLCSSFTAISNFLIAKKRHLFVQRKQFLNEICSLRNIMKNVKVCCYILEYQANKLLSCCWLSMVQRCGFGTSCWFCHQFILFAPKLQSIVIGLCIIRVNQFLLINRKFSMLEWHVSWRFYPAAKSTKQILIDRTQRTCWI